MCRDLEAVRQSICDYAKGFDATALTSAEAGRVVALCAAIEASVSTLKSLAAARLAGSGSWKHEGYRCAEEQLADRTGIGTGQARRALNNAKRLADHPEVAHAALSGELSAEQAELVAVGAEADRSKTAELIEKAKASSLSELRDEVSQVRANHTDREAERRRIHQARKLRTYTDLEGVWHLLAAGNVEDGITISQVLTPIHQRLNRLRRDRGQVLQPFEQLDYDALVALAQIAGGRDSELSLSDLLDLGLFPQHHTTAPGATLRSAPPGSPTPTTTGPGTASHDSGRLMQLFEDRAAEPTTSSRSSPTGDAGPGQRSSAARTPTGSGSTSLADPPPSAAGSALMSDPTPSPAGPGPAASRVQRGQQLGRALRRSSQSPKVAGRPLHLIIRVDLDTLLRGVAVEGELCEIPGYGPVPVSLIEELKANGNVFVSSVLTKSREVIGVYRHRRRPDVYQQTALDFLYPTCAAAGCNRRAGLDYEHRDEWAKTHYTAYDLMDRLCWHHHQQKTHQGWKLVEGTGKRAFVPPTDARHPDHHRPGSASLRSNPAATTHRMSSPPPADRPGGLARRQSPGPSRR